MNFKDNINEAANILNDIKSIYGDGLDYPESIDDLSKPVKFAVFGSYSTGKSTFINSFVFKDKILPAGVGTITKKTVLFSYSQGTQNLFNNQPFDLKELENLIHNSTKPLNEVNINNPNLKDYTVVDVPGYGGRDENEMEEIIKKGCDKADAIFFLFDVSKGLSGDDKEQSKKYLTHFLTVDSKTQIWTIFNKLDSEDDKTENEICELIAETLYSLKIISQNEQEDLDTYKKLSHKKAFALSAKKSLDGYCGIEIKGGIEKPLSKERADEILEESRMPFFREKFDSSLENARIETFVFRLNKDVDYIETEISFYENNLNDKIQEKNQLEQTLNHQIGVKEGEIDFIIRTKQNITNDLAKVEDFLISLNDSNRKNEIEKLKIELLGIFENCLIASISNYRLIGGDTKEELINKGIKNANENSKVIIEIFTKKLILNFIGINKSLQNEISIFNTQNPNNKLILSGIIDPKAYLPGENSFSNVSDAMLDEIVKTIATVISSTVASSIAVFFETRLAALLIPGVGWVLGGIGLAYSLWDAAGIGEKIAKKVRPEVHKALYEGEFPKKLTKILHEQLIDKTKIQTRDVIDVVKSNIQILSRLSAENEDEKKSIETEIQKSLIEKNLDISERQLKISNIKGNLDNLLKIIAKHS